MALLVVLAWSRRFVQDDAFISYRYARNLVEGQGLVFNPGERVEGYTNFVWTMLMAAGMRLGLPVIGWSHALGLACFAASLVLVFLLGRRVLASSAWSALAVTIVGTNFSFSTYATGGLETSLQTATVLLALLLALRALDRPAPRPAEEAAFSAAAAAALLTRLDSVVLLAPAMAALVLQVLRQPGPRERARCALALVLPGAIPLAAWFAWKLAYYGALLPVTFHAKTGGALGATTKQGLLFLYEYFASYWMFPQLLWVLVFAAALFRCRDTRLLAAACGLWMLYIVAVGGDFMEFRMMTPLLPAWTLCVLWPARRLADRRVQLALGAAMLVLALAGSWRHQATFRYENGIESVADLEEHLSVDRWVAIGQTLQGAFAGHEDRVTIAVTAAGAIPYYSRARTIDMLGLNDPWIARNGIPFKSQPGHERTAPFHYLLARGVNLVIAHPLVVAPGQPLDLARNFGLPNFRLFDARPEDVPRTVKLVEIPIGDGFRVLALYLTPNQFVDAAIRERGWRTWTPG
ncbi:MAG: hypothetical protein KBD01_01785 [Acidobacteria bacterium]|nr:hypothetical protein [Acidobacteriota bacterium]